MSTALKRAATVLSFSAVGLAALVGFEGSREVVYLDPVGIPTVCMGTTKGLTQGDVGRVFTPGMCEQRNREAVREAEAAVKRYVQVPLSQGQYDALVSLVFNIGGGAFRSSTLLKKINQGQCYAAAEEFPRWVYAQGKILRGLVLRRAQERATWIRDC